MNRSLVRWQNEISSRSANKFQEQSNPVVKEKLLLRRGVRCIEFSETLIAICFSVRTFTLFIIKVELCFHLGVRFQVEIYSYSSVMEMFAMGLKTNLTTNWLSLQFLLQ